MADILRIWGLDPSFCLYILKTYWLIPVGVLALYYYGRFHFNSPDYCLGKPRLSDEIDLETHVPLARLSGMVPPILTTSRSRYKKYSLEYVFLLQIVFLLVSCAPDLVAYAAKLAHLQIALAESVQHRAIWALFALTGLLSSFPLFKDIDVWILKKLHAAAAIPDAAEHMAQRLNIAQFSPDTEIYGNIISDLKTNSVRTVAAGTCSGELEDSWIKLRSIHDSLSKHMFADNPNMNLRFITEDHAVFRWEMKKLRERLTDFFFEQDKLIDFRSGDRINIDDVYTGIDPTHDAKHTIKFQMRERRGKFEEEVRALTLKACRLIAVAVFATDTKPEEMTKRFRQMGFQIRLVQMPAWNWDAILSIALWVFGSILVPSCIYGFVVSNKQLYIPDNLKLFVPDGIRQALFWSLMGSALHLSAVVIAIKVKRYFARRSHELGGDNHSEQAVIIIACYACSALISGIFAALYQAPIASAAYWALLPTISGAYVGKYINGARRGRPPSHFRAAKQASLMGGVTLLICFSLLVSGFRFGDVPTVTWLYTGYAVATVSLIGWTIGYFFQRLYSHTSVRDYADARPREPLSGDDILVCDFIVRSA